MLLYASNVAEVMCISTDMLAMIIGNNSIDVAYGLLVTIDRLNSLGDLAKHLSGAQRVLRDGSHTWDLVLEKPFVQVWFIKIIVLSRFSS